MAGRKRKRNNDAKADDGENENSNDELNSKVENLQKSVTEILGELQKLNEAKKNEESEAEKKTSFNSVISPGSLMKNTPSNGMAPVGKSFVLKHVFENVSKLEEDKGYFNEKEEHFGVPWYMYIVKKNQHLSLYLKCNKSLDTGKWAIETNRSLKFIGVNGKTKESNFDSIFGNSNQGKKSSSAWGYKKFATLEELKKDYLIDDKLTAEIYVNINKMTGVYKENSRNFDESVKECSDVILKVDDEKFYVSKLFLSFHSTYFKSLFLGNFKESAQSEIKLSGIAPEDFQKFLEVLYGDPSIDDSTVEGILLVADMYDTSIVVGKCEEFLSEKSEKSNKKKLQMAIRYSLDKLKKKCLSEIKTTNDIKSMISGNIKELDPSIMAELLEKSISLP